MLIKILAWFWIITGVIFLLKPQFLRNKFLKKSKKILKRYLFVLAIILGSLLIAAGWKMAGILSKIVIIVGIISIIKGIQSCGKIQIIYDSFISVYFNGHYTINCNI